MTTIIAGSNTMPREHDASFTSRLYANDDLESIGGRVSPRTLQVVLVIDTSGSMEHNGRMAKANNAVDVSLDQIREVQKLNPHVRIMVNVLSFASMVSWMAKEPQNVDTFAYQHLKAGGMTNLADALAALGERLHKRSSQVGRGFMDDSKSVYPPAIMFISDGWANGRDYHEELNKLLHNGYFLCAARTAIAIDDESIVPVLEELTGDPKTVFLTDDDKALAQTIEKCLLNSVYVSSTTGPTEQGTATTDVALALEDARMDAGDPSLGETQSWYDLVASGQDVDFS